MKHPKRLPEILNDDERKAILMAATSLKNQMLLRLMVNLGLRASEVLNLKLQDVDLKSGRLWVRQGKGKKDRGLWIAEEDLNLLKQYLNERGPITYKDNLFVTKNNKPILDRHLRFMVKRLSKKAGITKKIHPHSLRHTFASDLLKSTRNLFLVSQALGHANLQSTQVYLHLSGYELEEALKNFRNGNGNHT